MNPLAPRIAQLKSQLGFARLLSFLWLAVFCELSFAIPVTLTVTPVPSSTVAGNTIGFNVSVTAQTGSVAPTGTILVESQIAHERCSARVSASFAATSSGGCQISIITTATRLFTLRFLGDVGWDDANIAQPYMVSVLPAPLPVVGFEFGSNLLINVPLRVSAPVDYAVPPTATLTVSLGGASCQIANYLTESSCMLTPLNSNNQLVLNYPGDAHYGAVNGLVVRTVTVNAAPPLLSVPSAISVNESQSSIDIPLTRLSGTVDSGSFRVRLLGQTATVGEDLIAQDFSIPNTQPSISIPLVRDQLIESNETAQVEIYDVQGASFDRTIIDLTIVDNDTTAPQTFVVTTADFQSNGCAVNGCSFNEAIEAANASLGADRIEFNLPAAGIIDVPGALSQGDLIIDGRSQAGYIASTNTSGAPNGTMGVHLRLSEALQLNGRTELYGIAVSGNSGLTINGSGETRIQGCFLGADRFGAMSTLQSAGFSVNSNVILGGALAAERNILGSGFVGSSFDTGFANPGVRMSGNWVGVDRNGVFGSSTFTVKSRRLLLSNNDFFSTLTVEGYFGETLSDRWVRANRFSGPGGLQLFFVQQAIIGGSTATDANRFFNLTPQLNTALREGNIRVANSNADLRGNLMGGNPGRAVVVEDKRLNNPSNAMLLETLDDPFDADSLRNSDIRQRFQNAPEILSINRTATDVTLTYRVNSLPGFSRYPLSIEFFQAEDDEGKAVLGRDQYLATEAMTIKTITLPIPSGVSFAPSDVVLATATDADGHSSTFNRYPLRVRITQDSPDSSTSSELVTISAEFTALGPVAPFGKMLAGTRQSVQNATPFVFSDTALHYCRAPITSLGGNLATATCTGTLANLLTTSPFAVFASLGFDVPFALEIDQEAHTVRLPTADFSMTLNPAVASQLTQGVDACDARSFVVTLQNAGPDTASASVSLPRPTSAALQDWRYTCISNATVCGAITTGTTSLNSVLTLAANTSLDVRIDFRGIQTPRGSIRFDGGLSLQAPATDPTLSNNGIDITVPLTLFENGFEDVSPVRLCLPL